MVLDDGSVHGEQVQAASRVSMLKVGRETEAKDHIHGDLGADKLKDRGTLRDREQEDVSLFIG